MCRNQDSLETKMIFCLDIAVPQVLRLEPWAREWWYILAKIRGSCVFYFIFLDRDNGALKYLILSMSEK